MVNLSASRRSAFHPFRSPARLQPPLSALIPQSGVLVAREGYRVTEEMENHGDFFNFLASDVTAKILRCLDDPGDIVRASCVSRSWYNSIISDATSKKLCQKLCPQLSSVSHTLKISSSTGMTQVNDAGSNSNDWRVAKMEHEIFSSLAQKLVSSQAGGCISYAVSASSTNRYPDESIWNTLDSSDSMWAGPSYWSSSGQENPNDPEKLTYKLLCDLCVISQIDLRPFRANFHQNSPLYAARAVRFRMGHQKLPDNDNNHILDSEEMQWGDDKFVWTYTSPKFAMTQEDTLQAFKLPQPILCIGGFLQIELLGRVQRCELDSLFYFRVAYVQAIGRSLSPVFTTEVLESSGTCSLIYNPQAQFRDPQPIVVNSLATFVLEEMPYIEVPDLYEEMDYYDEWLVLDDLL